MIFTSGVVDATLLNASNPSRKWQIHSVFSHSFNVECRETKELVLVSFQQQNVAPHAIYLSEYDFRILRPLIQQGALIFLQGNLLRGDKFSINLNQFNVYHSTITRKNLLNLSNAEQFLAVTQKLSFLNGFGLTVGESLAANNHPFYQAISNLNQENSSLQKDAVKYLIGRGPGLTPSGDDSLLGYLALLYSFQLPIPRGVLMELQKQIHDPKATTAISQHYFRCGLQGKYSTVIHQMAELLAAKTFCKKKNEAIIAILVSYGHTSGVDLLSGWVLTLYFQMKEIKQWQNE